MGSTAELWCLTSAWQDVGSRSVSLKNTSLVTLISVIFGFLIKTAYATGFLWSDIVRSLGGTGGGLHYGWSSTLLTLQYNLDSEVRLIGVAFSVSNWENDSMKQILRKWKSAFENKQCFAARFLQDVPFSFLFVSRILQASSAELSCSLSL